MTTATGAFSATINPGRVDAQRAPEPRSRLRAKPAEYGSPPTCLPATDLTCRNAGHALSWPDVRRDDGAGADDCIVADADPLEDDRVRPDPDIVTHLHGCLDQRLSRNRAVAGAMVMVGDVAVRPDHALGADTYADGCVEHREPIDIGAPANEQFRPRATRSRREQDHLVIQCNHVVEGDIPRFLGT